jgi:4-hydroxybenzoate polyprenyltransferase
MMARAVREVWQQVRLLLLLLRPPLVFLLLSFALLGLAIGGHGQDLSLVVPVSIVVLGFLLLAVSVNDIADRAVDQINLPGKASRPLSTGTASSRDMAVTAVIGGVSSLGAAAWLGRGALLVASLGVLLALTYSLEPFSLSRRGAAASLILPAGFVGVPYLTATLAVGSISGTALCTLVALYIGFIGRILLKDFRDVVGDTLLGKRTFLVRHGRQVTCRLSAGCWTLGSVTLILVSDRSAALDLSYGLQSLAVLFFLRQLSRSAKARQDEAFVSAIAILGRGAVVTLLGHYALLGKGPLTSSLFLAGIAAMSLLSAWAMAQSGPVSRLCLPPWLTVAQPPAATVEVWSTTSP